MRESDALRRALNRALEEEYGPMSETPPSPPVVQYDPGSYVRVSTGLGLERKGTITGWMGLSYTIIFDGDRDTSYVQKNQVIGYTRPNNTEVTTA